MISEQNCSGWFGGQLNNDLQYLLRLQITTIFKCIKRQPHKNGNTNQEQGITDPTGRKTRQNLSHMPVIASIF